MHAGGYTALAAQIGENGLECVNAVKAGVARSGEVKKKYRQKRGGCWNSVLYQSIMCTVRYVRLAVLVC